MHIQKISRYVPVAAPTNSTSESISSRKMLMSLPRVKWLERDPDYKPNGFFEEDLPPPPPPSPNVPKAGMPLSDREDEIYKLRMGGESFTDIARRFGISSDTVRGMFSRARRKRGELI